MIDRKTHSGGFSLIELLMVIAVIVIIIALLLPSLYRPRETAKRLGCVSNMRQIGIATTQYAAGHDGFLPAPNWRRGGAHGWLYYNLQMDRPEHLQTGLLWPYLEDYKVYRCPADYWPDVNDPNAVPQRPNNSRMITSYCMNGSVTGYGGKPFNGATGMWETYRLSDFRMNDILYWETWEDKAGGWWWDGSNFPWEGLTYRHFDRGSAANADGSAFWMMTELYYRWADPGVGRTRLWNRPRSANGH